MDDTTQTHFQNLRSSDKDAQNAAYYYMMDVTATTVDWAYEVWDTLLEMLTDKDNHQRAIAGQLLPNLAISDPDNRMAQDFDAILAVTKDERFVTARHTLQSIWKIGLAGEPQRTQVMEGLERRFREASTEKNGTLIRFDIIQNLKNLYDETGDKNIHAKALELIELEEDPKYKKKYAAVWKAKK